MKRLVAIAAIALTAGGVAQAQLKKETSASPERVCLEKGKWTESKDKNRPCVFVRVHEDGSFNAKVRQADGDRWVRD